MPRPAEFDRKHVLHQAMILFWRQGYGVTSMKDLTRVTGLQPGSLYGAFNSKRALFLEALEIYFEQTRLSIRRQLQDTTTPLERIRRLFEWQSQKWLDDPDNKGCMLLNTLLEMPVEDEVVNARVGAMFRTLESELAAVLREAQRLNQIGGRLDPETLARTLLMTMHGIRVYCKTRPDPAVLDRTVDGFLTSLLNSPSTASDTPDAR